MAINFPEIVTFRITSQCTQHCRFCYGPKNIPALKFNDLKVVFQKFFDYGVKGVVLTGGEPLMRRDINKILARLKKYNFKIFLDTNGDLFSQHESAINQCVDVLGLPIDASSEQLAYRRNNLANVLNALGSYRGIDVRLKIKVGTVVTKENFGGLNQIAELLKQFPVDIWKLYQFIPSGLTANQNKNSLMLSDEIYFNEVSKLTVKYNNFFEIITSPRQDRTNAYFLINPDGQVIMPVDHMRQCQEVAVGN
ncbi:MAG: radical SAM protein, partial [Candidatus Parcubacteria bacterium]|nr:radical SAM protein [Candidatus Parcubacteria bacterium]